MTESLLLGDLLKLGVVSSGDAHFARLCAHEDAVELQPDVEVLAALVSRYLGQGHPCVPLAELGKLTVSDEDGQPAGQLPSKERLLAAAQKSLSVGSTEQQAEQESQRPLVIDAEERVYVSRYFEHEQRLARALFELMSKEASVEPPPQDWLTDRLDHYFPAAADTDDRQRKAAQCAISSPLAVISGGPGTGKTSTVVKILALLFEDAARRGAPPPTIRLLAPTGKAAARMMEATGSALERLSVPPELARHVQEASTIHRALGVIPGNATRFRRGPEHPIRADVVLVDEASMVDLALMRHLVESLRPSARLILLGDRHQLASVEAGSVLSELCAQLSQETKGTSPTVELTKSYRFSEDSGIAAFATQVREGQPQAALKVLAGARSDLHYYADLEDPFHSQALRTLVLEQYGAALRKKDPAAVLKEFAKFRVLCAHRRGKYGVEHVNECITQWLVVSGMVPGRGGSQTTGHEFYRGRLILITENDYGLGLFNGDVGVVWPDAEGRLLVFFEGEAGTLRSWSPAKLPSHETAFALTIHKSQGSEHDQVAVVLPPATSPLLTRELLYTGVTRARQRVSLFATDESVKAAAERSVTRHSGLGAVLSSLRSVRRT